MDKQNVINYLDDLVFSNTEKHFNDLQRSILEGVLNGQKYEEIKDNCHCSTGHIKDEAYKLWQLLSKVLNEDINKGNLKATIERITTTNYNVFVNPFQVGNNINFCHNIEENKKKNKDFNKTKKNTVTTIKIEAKLETIPRLLQLGLTFEQISLALDLPLELILESLKSGD